MNDAVYISNPSKYPLARWRIEAKLNDSIGQGCIIPLLKPIHAATSTTSRSNTQHNGIITSVKQISINNAITVYPNPATQRLNIKFNYKKDEIARISIMDVTGREVYSQEANDNTQISINVSGLPEGVYFVKATTASFSQIVRFIKE